MYVTYFILCYLSYKFFSLGCILQSYEISFNVFASLSLLYFFRFDK